jgi:hypothetical protein
MCRTTVLRRAPDVLVLRRSPVAAWGPAARADGAVAADGAISLGTAISGNRTWGMVRAGIETAAAGGLRAALTAATIALE